MSYLQLNIHAKMKNAFGQVHLHAHIHASIRAGEHAAGVEFNSFFLFSNNQNHIMYFLFR